MSRPYVDLTLEVLGDFGISYYREGYRYFQLPGGQSYLPREYEIEADASSASYFWAAAALTGGRVTITNLSLESSQGDAAFPEVLGRMGCAIESTPAGLTVQGGPLQGVDGGHGHHAGPGPHPGGAGGLRRKATPSSPGWPTCATRSRTAWPRWRRNWRKLGIEARETADGLVIRGGAPKGAVIHTYNDHRIAMSFAVAGLKAPGMNITDPDCVAKSFPDFWEFFDRLYV